MRSTAILGAVLWIALLTVASFAGTAALACRMPFAALAVLAACHMRRGDGIAMVLMVWATSQVTGFALLGYAHDATNLGWAAATGLGAVAAVLAAGPVLAALAPTALPVRLGGALVVAYAAFKLVVAGFALALGGVERLLAPALLARQFPREAAFLAGLLLAYALLVRLGVPRASAARVQAA